MFFDQKTEHTASALAATSDLQALLQDVLHIAETIETTLASRSNPSSGNSQIFESAPSCCPNVLREQVATGLKRRDKNFVKELFEKYCFKNLSNHEGSKSAAYIRRDKIYALLQDSSLNVTESEAEELFDEYDANNSDGLDLSELQLLLQKPSQLSEWAKSLCLHELLADAMPREAEIDPLRMVSALTPAVRRAVCEAVCDGLEVILMESSEILAKAFCLTDERKKKNFIDGSKFNILPVSCGKIDDFHAGVEGRIGAEIKFKYLASLYSSLMLIPLLLFVYVQVCQALSLRKPWKMSTAEGRTRR